MLKLEEFQNPLTGLNFQGTGTLTTPLGAKLLRTSACPAGKLIGLDKNYALEQICGSEITVEYDKLIDRQLERAAITSISGFAKLYTEASKVPDRMSTLQETVLTLARAVSGAGEQDEVLLETLCRAAEAYWRGRLRQGVTAEDCGEAFPCAAAFTAAADLAAGQDGGIESFTAGSVSVKGGGESAARRAESLRRSAEERMAPFASRGDFAFQGVRG